MSPELRKILADWLKWAENGAPKHEYFCTRSGLCFTVGCAGGIALRKELEAIFAAQGLDKEYPFGEEDYEHAVWGKTMHLDPNRLAWVRAQLEGEG